MEAEELKCALLIKAEHLITNREWITEKDWLEATTDFMTQFVRALETVDQTGTARVFLDLATVSHSPNYADYVLFGLTSS
jgi:hypothetical protein